MSLLPLPRSPETNQLSTISKSPRGTRAQLRWPMPDTPSINQLAESQPLENSHLPEMRYPPSTGVVVDLPVFNELEQRASGPSPKTSSWACSSQKPTSQAWAAQRQ